MDLTIREFAALCGISPATASRFFSGKPVSAAVRERLIEMRDKTGYMPPPGYRTRRKGSAIIVALIPDFDHCFYIDMIRHLRRCIELHGRQLVVIPSDERDAMGCMRLIDALQPMGVLLFSESPQDLVADALSERELPVVVVGGLALSRGFAAVHIDDVTAAYDGMSYLINLGHKRIGVLSDSMQTVSSGFQRVAGCRKAMVDAGMELQEENIVSVGTTYQDGYEGMGRLMMQCSDLTAVFAFSDDMAAGAMARLSESGVRVPEDMSVLGFDDNSRAIQLRPRLSTVHQPLEQIAERSIAQLIEMMERGNESVSLTLPWRVVERESCTAPKNK